jgi:hypothetical protein
MVKRDFALRGTVSCDFDVPLKEIRLYYIVTYDLYGYYIVTYYPSNLYCVRAEQGWTFLVIQPAVQKRRSGENLKFTSHNRIEVQIQTSKGAVGTAPLPLCRKPVEL